MGGGEYRSENFKAPAIQKNFDVVQADRNLICDILYHAIQGSLETLSVSQFSLVLHVVASVLESSKSAGVLRGGQLRPQRADRQEIVIEHFLSFGVDFLAHRFFSQRAHVIVSKAS